MTDPIKAGQYTQPWRIRHRWKLRALKVLLAIAMLYPIGWLTHVAEDEIISGYNRFTSYARSLVPTSYIEVEIDPSKKDVGEIVDRIAKRSGIPADLIAAIIDVESGGKYDRIRFEPHLLPHFEQTRGMTQMEHQMLASSIGLMQVVYGIHKRTCNLSSFRELLDPETNIVCGITVLRKCLEKQRGESQGRRLRAALGCYNGDPSAYPDKILALFAERALSKS